MTEQQSEYVDGKCEWCIAQGAVFRDNGLCDDCDSLTVHCKICDRLVHEDDKCRHVFRDINFEWSGSGGYAPTGDIKASLFRLLEVMPDGFALELKGAIEAKRFHTWMVAPLIGGGGILTLHGFVGRHNYSDALLAIGERDDVEDLVDGYRWLVSLYDDLTPEANGLTVWWLNQWLGSKAAEHERRLMGGS